MGNDLEYKAIISLSFSSLFNSVAVVRTSFLRIQLYKHQDSAFSLSKSLGHLSRLFSQRLTLQSSILLLLFQQGFIHRVELAF